MSTLIEYIPKHVREFLESQDEAIHQGVAFIENLDNEEDFLKADKNLERAEKTAQVLRGFLYLRFRDLSDGRTFSSFLAKRGIPRATAYDYISEAQIYSRLPNARMCATVSQMGQVKMRLLSSLPEEDMNAFLSGDPVLGFTVDEASEMSKADFKAALDEYKKSANATIAELQKKNKTLEVQVKTAELEKDSLLSKLAHQKDRDPFPDFVMATRHEAAAMSDKALLCIDDLTRLDEELHESAKLADGQHVEIALTSLYTHVNTTLARCQKLTNDMQNRWGILVTESTITGESLYSDDELESTLAARDLLIRDHTQEKRNRVNERENAKPRGRGRPKKQQP